MLDATLLFIPNVKQQSHKQESKTVIEHTSRLTEDKPKICKCVGALRRSTGASTSEVSIQSANQKCHTTLSDNNISQPKVNESQCYHSQR